MTGIEIARLAAAANILRPDWPTASIQTYLERDHAHRPLHDTAVALAWVATDPDSKTPKRMSEPGPWWQASRCSDDRRAVEPCPTHGPGISRRSDTGECANCRADRVGLEARTERDVVQPTPPPRPLRELVAAERSRTTTTEATEAKP